METAQRKLIGNEQLAVAIRTDIGVEDFVRDLGIYTLSALIEKVLDEHYPVEAFGEGTNLYPTWASNHGGTDIDPGVKWVSLLRHAVREAFGET